MSARRRSGGSCAARSSRRARTRFIAAAVVAAALLAACESAPIHGAGAQQPQPASSVAAAPGRAPETDASDETAASARRDAKQPAAAAAPESVAAAPREEQQPQQQPAAAEEAAASAPEVAPGAPSIRFKSSARERDDDEVDRPKETERGTASWYGLQFHGRQTANGERYNMYALTAAHKTLPFGTIVRVRSLQTGRSVKVRINDRGPYVQGRVIDLSKAAAEELGMAEQGLKPVSLTVTEWPDDVKEAASASAGKPGRNRSGKEQRTASRSSER